MVGKLLRLFPVVTTQVPHYSYQSGTFCKQGKDSLLAAAVGRDIKGKLSLILYALAIPSAFIQPWVAGMIYILVAMMWLVPDRRIEQGLGEL